MKLQSLGQCFELEQVGHFPHAIRKVHGLDVERELAAFDARDVERAFDQREQVLAAALDDTDSLPAVRRDGRVFAHELGVAQYAVERRAQFVADGADVAALGLVGVLGQQFGLLQRFVGLPVRVDFLHQQMGLAVGLFLRHLPAFVGQHHPPGHHAGYHQQRKVGFDKTRAQCGRRHAHRFGQGPQFLHIQKPENACEHRHDDQHHQQKMSKAGVQVLPDAARQNPAQSARPLGGQARLRFAHVAAARVQGAAQGADRTLVSGAMRHVGFFVAALTDHAAAHAVPAQRPLAGLRRCSLRVAAAGNVVTPAGGPGDQG